MRVGRGGMGGRVLGTGGGGGQEVGDKKNRKDAFSQKNVQIP